MKLTIIALTSFALAASPALAQAPAHEHKPACEQMMADKDGEHKCCQKDEDGNMVCKTMMDHGEMDHSKMDHAEKEPETPSAHHHSD